MDAVDYQNIATLGSLIVGAVATFASIYFKNNQGKYAGLLGESVALMQDIGVTLNDIQKTMEDKVITEQEVETIATMVEDMKGHVLKIQTELGAKA